MHEDELAKMPTGWTADGLASGAGFKLITLPYPVSVTETHPYHAEPMQPGARPILVLFSGSLDRGRSTNTGRQGYANLLRGAVAKALKARGALCTKDSCGLCAPGHEAACKQLLLHSAEERLWALVTQAVFCLEPAGDTLTRSHFFVAMASGCVPVLFDGGDGSPLYSPEVPTYWPWRLTNKTTVMCGTC